MSTIKVELGGKGVGLADQASIDLNKGCSNNCQGCYAAKTSRLGHKFGAVEVKEYNDKDFRRSCRSAIKKNIRIARLGKHTDCGLDICSEQRDRVISAATEEGLRLVFVTKSLKYSDEMAELLWKGDHILHISLGMTGDAPSNTVRKNVWREYCEAGVDVRFRLIDDVTKKVPDYGRDLTDPANYIITPMRYPSKAVAEQYGADLSKYKFVGGFYRPQEIHPSWNVLPNWCGEVGDKIYCCNCGVTNGVQKASD